MFDTMSEQENGGCGWGRPNVAVRTLGCCRLDARLEKRGLILGELGFFGGCRVYYIYVVL
jgi:hypothetical protein